MQDWWIESFDFARSYLWISKIFLLLVGAANFYLRSGVAPRSTLMLVNRSRRICRAGCLATPIGTSSPIVLSYREKRAAGQGRCST